jgi:Flp pilus assembly secretin CpaC
VSSSDGLLDLLRPGHLVDVQAVTTRRVGNETNVEVRTILERVPVLQVYRKAGEEKNQLPVVTLLVAPREMNPLALADSGAKVRLALRNPEDTGTLNASLASSGRAIRGEPAGAKKAGRPRVAIDVVLAESKGVQGLPEAATVSNEAAEGYAAISERRTVVASHETVNITAEAGSYGLRLRARPILAGNGRVKLRLEPEMSWAAGKGTASRRLSREIELPEGDHVMLTGLTPPGERNLVVIVSARRAR